MPVIAYLADHKAQTLETVSAAAESFAATHGSSDRHFLLAAGNAGIQAATNDVVRKANHTMLFWVYGAVILFCFVTFRSWRAVRSEEHTSELQSLMRISYAVFCLKKKTKKRN